MKIVLFVTSLILMTSASYASGDFNRRGHRRNQCAYPGKIISSEYAYSYSETKPVVVNARAGARPHKAFYREGVVALNMYDVYNVEECVKRSYQEAFKDCSASDGKGKKDNNQGRGKGKDNGKGKGPSKDEGAPESCKTRYRTVYYNEVSKGTDESVSYTEDLSYSVAVKGLNLVKGENEKILVNLSLDSLPYAVSESKLHSLSVDTDESGDADLKITIQAQRNKVRPTNTLSIGSYSRSGNTMNILIEDQGLDPAIGGEAYVVITPIEDVFGPNNIHHPAETFLIGHVPTLDGKAFIQMTIPMKKESRNLYFKARLIRKGSKYFNEGSSESIESKRLKD